MGDTDLFQSLKGGLIVSCQALDDEPLYGAETMAKLAKAAQMGGAIGIRANTTQDIMAIQEVVDLPIIGLVKKEYKDSEVFITPTINELQELINTDVDIIALDATGRKRPNGEELKDLINLAHCSDKYVMADISTFEEGMLAVKLGADCLSTTLSGYTPYSPQSDEPDYELLKRLVQYSPVPVIGEGRVSTPEQAREMLRFNAHAVVVGSAITRPQLITKRFVDIINEEEEENEQESINKSKLRVND